jgi:xanthine/uracil permease
MKSKIKSFKSFIKYELQGGETCKSQFRNLKKEKIIGGLKMSEVKEVKEVASDVIYGLNDNPGIGKSIVYSLQWLLFSTGLLILVPLIIGPPLGLSQQQIATLSQRIFFFTGVASLLQVLFGHTLPLVEGPSGLWWAVFIGLGSTASAMGMSLDVLRTNLITAMLIAGAAVALIGLTGLVSKAMRFFTPAVTGSVLVLLTLQLSGGYIKGALGVGFKGQPFSWIVSLISIVIVGVVVFISLKASPFFRSLAVFIGVLLGWITYTVLGYTDFSSLKEVKLIGMPSIFEWGAPTFDFGVTMTCVISGLILVANVLASMIAVARVSKSEVTDKMFNRGVVFNGIGTMLGGVCCTIGTISYATAAGLVSITGVAARLPFIFFSLILVAMGFVPAIGSVLATVPAPVGNAVALASMCTLFSFGIKDYTKLDFDNRDVFILGLSIMAGVGVMFLPPQALNALPKSLSYIIGNGMITGMIICILLEHVLLPKKIFVKDKSKSVSS